MARGIFSGLVWGTAVVVVGVGGLSLLYPEVQSGDVPVPFVRPDAPPPNADSQAPDPSSSVGEEPAADMSAEAGTTTTGQIPDAPAPATQETGVADGTDPVTMPQAQDAAGEVPSASESEPAPDPVVGEDAPDVPDPASGLTQPQGEQVPGSESVPVLPDVQTETSEPATPATGQTPNAAAPLAEAESGGTAPGLSAEAGAEMPLPGQEPPEAQASPEAQAPATESEPEPEAANEPAVVPDTAGPETAPRTTPGQPAGQIGNIAENVTTNRLPSIGSPPESPPGGSTEASAGASPDDSKAIMRNAAPFSNPDGLPVMSVILQDVGADRSLLGDLKNLPFPISFVVDASAEDASDAIQFYKNAGAEVVLAVPLPAGAEPKDADVSLQAYAPLLENAVAVLMPKATSFQTSGPTATEVAAILGESGLGLITLPQGLNTGHKSALKEGVAAGLVFRELDNDGQSGAVIRRFLDNAAFKARQNPGVILLGHARVETIQALIEWSLGNRAKSITLAPVSAVLLETSPS